MESITPNIFVQDIEKTIEFYKEPEFNQKKCLNKMENKNYRYQNIGEDNAKTIGSCIFAKSPSRIAIGV